MIPHQWTGPNFGGTAAFLASQFGILSCSKVDFPGFSQLVADLHPKSQDLAQKIKENQIQIPGALTAFPCFSHLEVSLGSISPSAHRHTTRYSVANLDDEASPSATFGRMVSSFVCF